MENNKPKKILLRVRLLVSRLRLQKKVAFYKRLRHKFVCSHERLRFFVYYHYIYLEMSNINKDLFIPIVWCTAVK